MKGTDGGHEKKGVEISSFLVFGEGSVGVGGGVGKGKRDLQQTSMKREILGQREKVRKQKPN